MTLTLTLTLPRGLEGVDAGEGEQGTARGALRH